MLHDLSEIKRLQKAIRQKEKLATIGGLAAGIAHEIRNPLSSIKGIASYFRDKAPKASEDYDIAEVMVREVDRLNRVITEFLEFARPTEINVRPVKVAELLEHSVRLVRHDAEANGIRIGLTCGKDLDSILVDPDRLNQCLLNLYLNAIQAMGKGGELDIKGYRDGGTICIEIADTGPGIPGEYMERIFDPYFTTKPSGSGLGLAIVFKIIDAHGGKIFVANRKLGGARFIIQLPVAPPAGI